MEEHTPFKNDMHLAFGNGGDVYDEVRPIDSYINAQMPQAANEMLRVMPIALLRYVDPQRKTCTPDTDDNRIGSIALPTDFLRLHTLRMKGWARPVHIAYKENDPEYTLQFNEWTRGTKQKPAVTIDGNGPVTAESNRAGALHYYSVDAGAEHTAKVFWYIPVFDKNNEYDSDAAELIALNCARKVCEVFGMTEQTTFFTNEIKNVLENVR